MEREDVEESVKVESVKGEINILCSHCPKNNLIFHIKTNYVTVGADARTYCMSIYRDIYTLVLCPEAADSVFFEKILNNFGTVRILR